MSKSSTERSEPTPPTPEPTLGPLSERTQRGLQSYIMTKQIEDEESVLNDIKQDLEGQSVGALEEILDWLRDRGLYPLSVPLLEEAWNAELPLDVLGRVAQDWVGTILYGIGDELGAREVVGHLQERAIELGATFCSDWCDVLIEWGMYSEATPLANFVLREHPGDLSGRFHLGICHKMSGDYTGALQHFEEILNHQIDPATQWNLGIAYVALRDWTKAREMWGSLGFKLPEGEGDYAALGELSPVRLKQFNGSSTRSEVVWGVRVGPARLLLTGIPYYHPDIECGDTLLIDGVKEGEAQFQGDSHPISPVLDRWALTKGVTFRLYGQQRSQGDLLALDKATQTLGESGWAIAHWSAMVPRQTSSGAPLLQLGVYLPPDREINTLHETLTGLLGPELMGRLYGVSWAERTGEAPEEHRRALAELGVKE